MCQPIDYKAFYKVIRTFQVTNISGIRSARCDLQKYLYFKQNTWNAVDKLERRPEPKTLS